MSQLYMIHLTDHRNGTRLAEYYKNNINNIKVPNKDDNLPAKVMTTVSFTASLGAYFSTSPEAESQGGALGPLDLHSDLYITARSQGDGRRVQGQEEGRRGHGQGEGRSEIGGLQPIKGDRMEQIPVTFRQI